MASEFPISTQIDLTSTTHEVRDEWRPTVRYGDEETYRTMMGGGGRDEATTQGGYWSQLFQKFGFVSQGSTADPRGPLSPSSLLELGDRLLPGSQDAGTIDPIYLTGGVTYRDPSDGQIGLRSSPLQAQVDALLERLGAPLTPSGGTMQRNAIGQLVLMAALAAGAVFVVSRVVR